MPALVRQPAGAGARARLAASVLALFRWRAVVAQPIPAKAVVIFYPHTSNWDFVIGLLAKWALELDIHWVGKDSLFHGPLRAVSAVGAALRSIAASGRDRSRGLPTSSRRASAFFSHSHPKAPGSAPSTGDPGFTTWRSWQESLSRWLLSITQGAR
jgi:1-acyl-sn-glycerol-3-phosphate acyltransferase